MIIVAHPSVSIYARVSTIRQEQNKLSIPDQVASAERWITENGGIHVQTFTEAGSATDDVRRQFQAMIALAESEDHPVDIILVHSPSRLFRNALHFMQYRDRLRRLSVRIVSISQNFGNDPASDLVIGMLALFDEYHSAENGKHVRRTMIANAAKGYWNGQTPPLGFRTVTVPQAQGKDRKCLEHDPTTIDTVRLIFNTYRHGTTDGPIGLTGLAQWLYEKGYRLRGNRFHASSLHAILTNTAYIGYVIYNRRDSRTGEQRSEDEWVPIPVPAIIDEEMFYAVAAQMAERDPRMGEAADKTNLNLLTKLATCGCDGDGCGGTMGSSTGKSGRYAYYTCSNRVKLGPSACGGRWMPMGRLDAIVVDALAMHLLQPARLHTLLQTWMDRSEEAVASRRAELKRLRARLTQLDAESSNLLQLVRRGIMSPDDPQLASEMAQIKAQRISTEADATLIERQIAAGDRRITPKVVERFGDLLRQKLTGPDDRLRRAYVRLLVDRVQVGNTKVCIIGSRTSLAHALAAEDDACPRVPKAERGWRATQSKANPSRSNSHLDGN